MLVCGERLRKESNSLRIGLEPKTGDHTANSVRICLKIAREPVDFGSYIEFAIRELDVCAVERTPPHRGQDRDVPPRTPPENE